jgi:hypothetical protein
VRERTANRTREAGHLDEIQGVVANTLKLSPKGAVGFIDRLDYSGSQRNDGVLHFWLNSHEVVGDMSADELARIHGCFSSQSFWKAGSPRTLGCEQAPADWKSRAERAA